MSLDAPEALAPEEEGPTATDPEARRKWLAVAAGRSLRDNAVDTIRALQTEVDKYDENPEDDVVEAVLFTVFAGLTGQAFVEQSVAAANKLRELAPLPQA